MSEYLDMANFFSSGAADGAIVVIVSTVPRFDDVAGFQVWNSTVV